MGNGSFEKTTCQSANNYSGAKFFLQDVNGDGLTDLIKTHPDLFLAYITGNGIIPYLSDGNSNTSYTNNSIILPTNAVIHKQGLGFRGFTEIIEIDNRNRSTSRIYDPFNFGVLESEDSPVASNSYTYSVNVASNKIAKINRTGSSSQDLLKNTKDTLH
jgi:hypothetical protein